MVHFKILKIIFNRNRDIDAQGGLSLPLLKLGGELPNCNICSLVVSES